MTVSMDEKDEGSVRVFLFLLLSLMVAIVCIVGGISNTNNYNKTTVSAIDNTVSEIDSWVSSQGLNEKELPASEYFNPNVSGDVAVSVSGTTHGYCVTAINNSGIGLVVASNEGTKVFPADKYTCDKGSIIEFP